MMDVELARSADDTFTMVLPGTWAHVPLDTPEHARQAAQALVRERVGRDDRLATIRRAARDDLVKTAAEAALAGANGLWLALEILPGIPLPASLITRAVAGTSDASAQDRLRALRPTGTLMADTTYPIMRSRAHAPSRVDPDKQALAMEYVVTAPRGDGVLIVNAAAPVVDEREPYTTLFDMIMDSFRWRESGTA